MDEICKRKLLKGPRTRQLKTKQNKQTNFTDNNCQLSGVIFTFTACLNIENTLPKQQFQHTWYQGIETDRVETCCLIRLIVALSFEELFNTA